MNQSVTLHGNVWSLLDLQADIDWASTHVWTRKAWMPSDALVHKRGGITSLYRGQKYDPEKIDLVKDGWDHDHCCICYWALCSSEDIDCGTGYQNEEMDWICLECHEKLIKE